MKFILTKIDLQKYIDQVNRQREILKLSLLFSDKEKEEIQGCFDDLIAICNARLDKEQTPKNTQLQNAELP